MVNESQDVHMQEHVDSLHSSNEPHDVYIELESNSNQSNKDFDDPVDWNRDNLDLINHILSNPPKISMHKTDFSSSEYRDDKNLESTFFNIDLALQIFLTTVATNCSGERSFSTLKKKVPIIFVSFSL